MILQQSFNVKEITFITIILITAIYTEINIVLIVMVGLKALTTELAEIILNRGGSFLLNVLDLEELSQNTFNSDSQWVEVIYIRFVNLRIKYIDTHKATL